MKVLVTAASKHGATMEIARAVADTLVARNMDVTLTEPDDRASIDEFDAIVLGSSIYAGRWLKPAKEFIERHREALATRPVWLFSSGPIGDPPKPEETPPEASQMTESAHARDHRIFAGKLERSGLSMGERMMVKAVKAPFGDFRDWPEIKAWAEMIADALEGPRPGSDVTSGGARRADAGAVVTRS